MGMDMHVYVKTAVELDTADFFEHYEAIPTRFGGWCDHQELFEEDTKFCPECGKERPKPRTFSRTREDAPWPPEFLDALRDEGTYSRLEDYVANPDSMEGELGSVGGLCFFTIPAEDDDDEWPRLFIGRGLVSFSRFDGEAQHVWNLEGLDLIMEDVTEKVNALGFGGSARLLVYNKWW